MRRALHLYWLSLLHAQHRLRHDLGREIVVALCAGILSGLFYYVFNDFLNIEIRQLSEAMRQRFGTTLGFTLLFLFALMSGRLMAKEWLAPENFGKAASYLGEERQVITLFWSLRIPTLLLVYHVPAWLIAKRALVSWNFATTIQVMTLMVAVTAFVSTAGIFYARTGKSRATGLRPLLRTRPYKPFYGLFVWRMKQIFLRNPSTQVILCAAGFMALCLGFFAARGAPHLVNVGFAYLAGLLTGSALVLQISYDLPMTWMEKQLGVSHTLYLNILQALACALGASVALLCFLSYCLALLFCPEASQSQAPILQGSQLAFVAFTSPFLVPYLTFQIDGRRSGIQMITLILASLFVATAIFASMFSLALLPLITYYGLQSQAGRFYRA